MPNAQLDPNPPVVKALPTPDTNRLKDLYPDLPDSPAKCKTCRGKKTFRWYSPDDPTQVVDYDCNCVDQFFLHRWLLNAGIDLAYQRMSWRDATGVPKSVVKEIKGYIIDADRLVPAGIGLLMLGQPGTGKTMLSTLILKDLISQGYKGYFTTFHNMLDRFTEGWSSVENKVWFDGKVRNAGVLVIDDMGREHKGRIDIAISTLDHVLRARVASARPTILTSNLSTEQISELYTRNALSLLSESSITLNFLGEDFRPTQKTTRIEEAREGLTRPLVIA